MPSQLEIADARLAYKMKFRVVDGPPHIEFFRIGTDGEYIEMSCQPVEAWCLTLWREAVKMYSDSDELTKPLYDKANTPAAESDKRDVETDTH